MTATYTYGATTLHDGVNYFLMEKDIQFPDFKQSLYPIARNVGVKKVGERQDEVLIPVLIKVVSILRTRADLESKLDTLFGGLQLRQQQLTLHTLDTRYWIADAITGKVKYTSGQIIAALVPVVFVAQDPFLFSSVGLSGQVGSSTMLYQSAVTGWQSPNASISIPINGTAASAPTLTFTNNTLTNVTHLTAPLVNGNVFTSLSVAALSKPMGLGTVVVLNDGAGHTQNVTLSVAPAAGATTLTVISFTANFSYPITTTSVTPPTTITQLTIQQLLDSTTLVVGPMTLAVGQILTIICDVTASGGGTCTIGGGSPLPYTGIFPVLEPAAVGTSTWQLNTPAATTQPVLGWSFNWFTRYVA